MKKSKLDEEESRTVPISTKMRPLILDMWNQQAKKEERSKALILEKAVLMYCKAYKK